MSDSYFYANGQKVQMAVQPDLVAIKFRSRLPPGRIDSVLQNRQNSLEAVQDYPELQQGSLKLFRLTNRTAADKSSTRDFVGRDDTIESVGEIFTTDRGEVLVMTDELVAKFQPLLKRDEVQDIVDANGLEITERIEFDENTFVLRVKDPGHRASTLANALVESGQAVYAHPSFLQNVGGRAELAYELEERPPVREERHGVHATDPRFAEQWHLENVGQVAGGVAGTVGADARVTLAWSTTMGNPAIRLGVIDLGTDIAHADLNAPGKVVAPLDLTVSPPDANPVGNSHGTQVAGMAVGSANNGIAGAGVAPNCRVIPVRVADPVGPQLQMARGFVYAAEQGADVITCSLGPSAVAWTMTDVLRTAIDYATSFGRNGRGCVYTQAVDNNAVPVSIDQVSSYERAIAVGRTNNRDLHDGSATGPELDISAPGASVTMITNTTATNNGTTTVSTGTSFATPLTAGVACLVLSVNPNLSWEEVRQVLLSSADKIDAGANPYAAAPAGSPAGTRNDRYGYGRVNAEQAVAMATAPTNRDLFIRDNPSDDGSVPQPAYGFWDSPDIWVRNADDGGTAHQDTIRGRDNFLYARISNRGSMASHPCWVNFYVTSYAGTEFRYPFDYKLDTTTALGTGTPGRRRPLADFPAVGTYLVGTERIDAVPAFGNRVVRLRWPAALIPPHAGWHPCLLVEITPHDGPTATGQYVWDDNNLGQKNITIREARPGERLSFPFIIGHPLAKTPKQSVVINRLRAPANLKVAFAAADPKLITALPGLDKPVILDLPALADGLRPLPLAFSPASSTKLPFKLTFLEEAKVALSTPQGREDGETLVLTFAAQSQLELGAGPAAQAQATPLVDDGDDSFLFKEPVEDTPGRAGAPFQLATLEQRPALQLNPAFKRIPLEFSSLKPQSNEASLVVDVPADAKPGERYYLDVEQRDGNGVVVGGVRLQIVVRG